MPDDPCSIIARNIARELDKKPFHEALKEPCHLCRRQASLEPLPFTLFKHISTERDWAGLGKRFVLATVVSIPLSLIGFRTLPNPIPDKRLRGEMRRFLLMVCPVCVERRRGWRGRVRLTRPDY